MKTENERWLLTTSPDTGEAPKKGLSMPVTVPEAGTRGNETHVHPALRATVPAPGTYGAWMASGRVGVPSMASAWKASERLVAL